MTRTRTLVTTGPSVMRFLPAALFVLDVVLLTATGALALLGRESLPFVYGAGGIREHLGIVAAIAIPIWIGLIAASGGYAREVLGAGQTEFARVLRACLINAGLIGVGCYLAKYQLSRGFFLLAFAIGPILLLLGRLFARIAIQRLRRNGHLYDRVLIVGRPERIDEMQAVLRRESWLGYRVIGAADSTGASVEETPAGVPVLGAATDLVALAHEHHPDVIVLTGGVVSTSAAFNELVWALEHENVEVVIAPSVTDIAQSRLRVRPVGGVPLIHVDRPRWTDAGRFGKRLFDIVGSLALIAILTPIFAVAIVSIWLHDRGPLFFSHQRVGRNGVPFGCLKFRTMVIDAESQAITLQEQSGQAALLFKMKDDPRITRPGRWLRRLSIDELPQLYNVLRGDMSLVGPRPQVQREVDLYRGGMSRRLLVRPGVTGLWQVSGRNDLTPEEAMRLDVSYVDNWSMLQDVAILFRTVRAVLSSRGAY